MNKKLDSHLIERIKRKMIYLADQNGRKHILDAAGDCRVMEIIREHGFMQGTCDGLCECATFHVYIDEPWIKKFILRKIRI